MVKGSDLLVAALEHEGVDRTFGVPGEENLDVVESLRNSRIQLEASFKGGGVHLVDVAIDYSENTRVLVEELRNRKLGVEPQLASARCCR